MRPAWATLLAALLCLAASAAAEAFDCRQCCPDDGQRPAACEAHVCACKESHFDSGGKSLFPDANIMVYHHRHPSNFAPSPVPGATPAPLTAARVYLRAGAIPPKTAAYGIVALRSRPTPASHDKLVRVCTAYKSFLPTDASLPSSVTDDRKMLTVWPLDNPDAAQAKADDCEFVLAHYDLYAGQSAIADAASGGEALHGDGPYLIGWSPSETRGVKDKLVLVVDLGGVDTQAGIDDRFKFWQKEIIEKPEQWKHGFSLEGLRVSVRDFMDHYGSDLMAAVKLVTPN